jgi:DNA-binding transcriptional regulator YhcF (GntR family)
MAWLPKSYHDTIKKVWQSMRGVEEKTVRARTKKGTFVADDKATPEVNEAYKTVEVKKKRKRGRPRKKK